MPVVSNGQSSGSDSDSAEIRFNKKTAKSQRQRSSSTSAYSSDSEPEQGSAQPSAEKPAAPHLPKKKPDGKPFPRKKLEVSESQQVSTRPVAEKLTIPSSPKKKSSAPPLAKKKPEALPSPKKKSEASLPEQVSAGPAAEKPAPETFSSHMKKSQSPPSPTKKPDSSVRSAVRNEGTPLERNPKAPSTSNLKRVAAEKRAKVDHAAEEQPGPKEKSVSKGKRPIEDETEPSNPTKKSRKQQQESAAKEAKDGLNEFLEGVKKLLNNSEAQTRAILKSYSDSANSDADLEGVYSNRGFPVVEEDKVQLMKAKWRAFQIRELEVKKQRYELLQEECSLQMEALEKPSGNGTFH